MNRKPIYLLLLFIMLSGLTACGPAHAADRSPPDATSTPPEAPTPTATSMPVDAPAALVTSAKADLAERLGLTPDQIVIDNITPTEFSDASLGVAEPGQVYAQVITPGYIIELNAEGERYRYHAGDGRVVAAPSAKKSPNQPPDGKLTIEGVEVTEAHVIIRGISSLPNGAEISTELWADGTPQSWWPADARATVEGGTWSLEIPLEAEMALQPGVQYMIRAYQPDGPNVVSTFPFDLDAPPQPPAEDPALFLPESAEPVQRASADLNGDGTLEEIVLAGWGGACNCVGYEALQMFVLTTDGASAYDIAWQSTQLPSDRTESMEVQDVNGDGLPEVVSLQTMGANGESLYLLGWQNDGCGWLTPQGGHFDGQNAFGENGARVQDMDGDGIFEILASYGPAAAQTDVYAWDGEAYVYQRTMDSVEASYVRAQVTAAGLSLDVPAAWTEIAPGIWAASEEAELRLGVRATDLEPPQEPEAALLPQPAQVLEAVPVELNWGSGRRFTVEVYEEAEEGTGQAPVQAVEIHVLVVLEREGTRRAYDVFVAAPDAQRLRNLETTLQHVLASVDLD